MPGQRWDNPLPFVRKDNVAKDKSARPWPALPVASQALRIYFSYVVLVATKWQWLNLVRRL